MHKHKPKWLPINGTAEITEGLIRHVGLSAPKRKKVDAPEFKPALPWVTLRSDTYFQDGDLTCEVNIENAEAKVQFRLGSDGSRVAFVGLNMRESAYGIVYRDATADPETFIARSLAGARSKPETKTWLPLQIKARGSNIELFINQIRVAHCQITLPRAQIELALQGIGEVQVRNIQVATIRPQVFVVMQFTDEFNELYREVICPVCSEFGYEVVRGDNVYSNGLIIQDITRSIREASLVIADITPNNANVYYEVGFAHGIDKPTILLSDRKREKLPFDISGFRLLFYENSIGGKSEVESALRRHLEALQA